jgi:uncharacterized repeat protein (TIGR03847 family)
MTSFDLDPCERFTAGAIGEPGQRVFYLQAAAGGETATLKVEKTQVGALARYLAQLLADLPTPAPSEVPAPELMELVEPTDAEWTVGSIAVAFDDNLDRMIVRAEELVDDEDELAVLSAQSARVVLTRGQVQAFVIRGATLVAAGRPPCPLCGLPMDPEGHVCIKTNGHKKS